MTARRIFKNITYWIQTYGMSGAPDRKSVEDFMECETDEAVNGLRAELYTVSQGKFDKDYLDQIVGLKRSVKHGTYEEWARIMVLWMASYKG